MSDRQQTLPARSSATHVHELLAGSADVYGEQVGYPVVKSSGWSVERGPMRIGWKWRAHCNEVVKSGWKLLRMEAKVEAAMERDRLRWRAAR